MTRALVLLLRFAAGTVALLAGVGWLAWLVGQVMTDRTAWSQWLHWIPTAFALPLALIVMIGLRVAWPRPRRAAAGAPRPAGRHPVLRTGARLATWAMLITAVVRFAVVEHRLLASAPEDPPGIKIVQWTIGEGSRVPYAAIADQVVGMDPDVAILTNAPWIGGEAALRDWVEREGARRLRSQPFEIIVRRPLIEMRGLVSPDVRRPTPALVRLVVAAPDLPDGRLVLALVDLESDPRRPRHEIADEAIALFTEAWEGPPPDVVIGDFNMQRGSASMRRIVDALMPGPTRHVQAEGGHGYAATWSEGFPLWHIDHAWIGPDVACVRYDTPLITAWRHYPQVLWLVPRPEVAADAG